MKINLNWIFTLFVLCGMVLTSCKDAWKSREELSIGAINKTVLEELSQNEKTTEFYKLLVKTGVDKILMESRSFTVWAPDNDVVKALDNALLNDNEALKNLVLNHISYQTYFTKDAGEGRYIRVLNGKNILFESEKFEDYPILTADIYLRNGVLHITQGTALPKPNALEYLASLNNKQYQFFNQLYYDGLDVSEGVILYYDPITGEPVYQEGTTKPMVKNSFLDDVYNINSEDSLFTYIILSDEAFDQEVNFLKPYNKAAKYEFDADSVLIPSDDLPKQDSLSKFQAIKDLVVSGIYTKEQLTLIDSLTTSTGVKVKILPTDIVATKRLSNGIAHVVKKVQYKVLDNKIPPIIIQGTDIDSLRVPSTTIIKTIKDSNNKVVKQLETTTITSSPSPLYYFRYKIKAQSTRYAVYWRARNTLLTVPFSMGVVFRSSKSGLSQLIPENYHPVPVYDSTDPDTFKETLVGHLDVLYSGKGYVFLMSSQGATSALPTALALNYIKLVPIN